MQLDLHFKCLTLFKKLTYFQMQPLSIFKTTSEKRICQLNSPFAIFEVDLAYVACLDPIRQFIQVDKD